METGVKSRSCSLINKPTKGVCHPDESVWTLRALSSLSSPRKVTIGVDKIEYEIVDTQALIHSHHIEGSRRSAAAASSIFQKISILISLPSSPPASSASIGGAADPIHSKGEQSSRQAKQGKRYGLNRKQCPSERLLEVADLFFLYSLPWETHLPHHLLSRIHRDECCVWTSGPLRSIVLKGHLSNPSNETRLPLRGTI
ncbi:hypothetical protein NE237_032472 [Protea cynaroides]|uniref:Uncharacterized protein n=1 Tax=Protea cynaroides TaxID=273540 RepID=A0A9Q0L3L4_9MAGN|nr:hypothetical protein NE237_032472 [Protea cynaroides]